MKIRPHRIGYLVLYALCLLCIGDTVYTLFCQVTGRENAMVASFGFLSYLITAAALVYGTTYLRAHTSVSGGIFRTVGPVMRRPREGEKRASFLFRQGGLDMQLWDKSFPLQELVRYGYCEDIGVPRVDESDAKATGFMPVHEIAFILTENRRCHMNAGAYSEKQIRRLIEEIKKQTGLSPEGELSGLLENDNG